MIVFIESNFVLEIVLQQAEAPSASRIVDLAAGGRIQLCVPAFSLVEPHHKLMKERSERRILRQSLEMQVGQMARSACLPDIRAQSNALLAVLANKSDEDMKAHESWIDNIVRVATVLPLTKEVLAPGLARSLLDLELRDAFVYSSIESHLNTTKAEESIFANRDAKGFMQPTVLDDLEKLRCKVIPTFGDALAYVESRVPPSGSA